MRLHEHGFRALSIQRLEGSRPRFAADAGPMQIQWWEGAVSSCAKAVRQSATRNCMRSEAGRMRKRILSSVVEELEGLIGKLDALFVSLLISTLSGRRQ
jgi:hypothetical protein